MNQETPEKIDLLCMENPIMDISITDDSGHLLEKYKLTLGQASLASPE